MSTILATICYTLIILAFCQVIIEAVLPEGSTKRYVAFIIGFITVVAIIQIFSMSRQDLAKLIFSKTAEMKQTASSGSFQQKSDTDPYKEYIEKLIDTYK